MSNPLRAVAFLVGAWLLLTSISMSEAVAEPAAVAYIKGTVPSEARIGDVLRVVRSGKDQPLPPDFSDLQSGDKLFVKQGAVRIVILGTGRIVTIAQGDGGANQPDFVVPSAVVPGLTDRALAFIKAIMAGPDRSAAVQPVTRGGGTCCNPVASGDPTPFTLPVLFAEHPMLGGGRRSLFVSWRGGRAPFEVALLDRGKNETVVKLAVSRGCTAWLPATELRPGRHRLSITDANGSVLSEDNLAVGGAPPAMPRELAEAALPDEARRLYYATWLAATEGGRWAFEAQQLVAAMNCRSDAVREWLERWGTAPACDAP